jgi:6-phosphogluconolactonase
MGHDADDARVNFGRRVFVGGALGGLLLPSGAKAADRGRRSTMARMAYVGCRTSRDRNAKGDGIGVYRIAPDGGWTRIQLVGDLINPSYLAFDRKHRFLFTVHGDGSEASAFRIDPATGRLAFVDRAGTGGRNPVHIAVDPGNLFAVVTNHVVAGGVRSGLASLPIGPDGRLGDPVDIVPFDGAVGPHRTEQPFPKPHQAEFSPDGRYIVVPDKGCDRVAVYRIDEAGRLRPAQPPVAAREGSGPRHVAFHPGSALVYVVNELDSTVAAYRFDRASGGLTPFQIVSALPDSFVGNSRAAEIAVSADGRHLYASNRGHDSIVGFAVDSTTGRLSAPHWVPSGGRTPRFFALAPGGGELFVANEEGHNILRYERDASSGRLVRPAVVAETGSPTCLLFSN